MQEWWNAAVGGILEQPWWMWLVLAVLVAFGVALIAAGRRVKWDARTLAYAALCVALSFVLSCVRLWRMPQGGSITLGSMLPVMIFAYAYGTLPGLAAGVAYGFLQLLQGADIIHPLQLILDYPVAFGALGCAGVLRNAQKLPDTGRFVAGIVIAGLLRVLISTLSGVVFFAEYAPEGQHPLVYSLIYNVTSIGVDTLLCAVLSAIPAVRKLPARLRAALPAGSAGRGA